MAAWKALVSRRAVAAGGGSRHGCPPSFLISKNWYKIGVYGVHKREWEPRTAYLPERHPEHYTPAVILAGKHSNSRCLLFLRWTAQQREMMSWVFQSLSRRGPSQSRSFEWPWLGWGCGWLRWRPDPPLGLGFDALKRYSSGFVHSKISSGNCKFPPQLFF